MDTRHLLCWQEPTQPRKETMRIAAEMTARMMTGSWNVFPWWSNRTSARESGNPAGSMEMLKLSLDKA